MASSYDIIIIGGGPAGLSAASAIVRQDHRTLLLDSGDYRNAESKHMHTVPTWDHQDPKTFRDAARKNLERYGTVDYQQVEVRTAKKLDDLFEVSGGGKSWTGKKLILATGVEDIFPDIPGYKECWVQGIFHCLYCHGWEEKGAPSAGVLATEETGAVLPALHFARQALRMTSHVVLYTNGNTSLASSLTTALAHSPAPMHADARKILKLEKAPDRASVTLHFADDTIATEAFLVHKPKFRLKGDLAAQLGLEMTSPQGTCIKVFPPFNQTSVKGVFAAGDCAGNIQTVTAAMHSGTCTGGGAPLQVQAELYGQRANF
ncbi:hypothetical protein CFE70_007109 [Pyrenophora teres f. teres 0-1]|uniref:FAD/NAD(P)-binding domain-containing protein n=2 Tax=Pyrenophora teres f. teres TaxID=97479 RepID=E3S9P3_PYRTT|nr:hypothetical protein PTT_19779 [Pyrenophora teres f. teres 0-1]KAE8825896.1 hypothetical protein HRS9139_09006 [Pyrenophora teres f. teres]KAE8834995.1 hypothetical protein PTNB85_06328 [Pyrenophora teres f. teres]KAE8861284.1 hypothetical protein PTNB29_06379 [Pyrenophora teres f. teres]KAK1908485.1 hypothetical protein P3342_009334 [Pyrenophora teres f. teres]